LPGVAKSSAANSNVTTFWSDASVSSDGLVERAPERRPGGAHRDRPVEQLQPGERHARRTPVLDDPVGPDGDEPVVPAEVERAVARAERRPHQELAARHAVGPREVAAGAPARVEARDAAVRAQPEPPVAPREDADDELAPQPVGDAVVGHPAGAAVEAVEPPFRAHPQHVRVGRAPAGGVALEQRGHPVAREPAGAGRVRDVVALRARGRVEERDAAAREPDRQGAVAELAQAHHRRRLEPGRGHRVLARDHTLPAVELRHDAVPRADPQPAGAVLEQLVDVVVGEVGGGGGVRR
jgi:hypothetical protein